MFIMNDREVILSLVKIASSQRGWFHHEHYEPETWEERNRARLEAEKARYALERVDEIGRNLKYYKTLEKKRLPNPGFFDWLNYLDYEFDKRNPARKLMNLGTFDERFKHDFRDAMDVINERFSSDNSTYGSPKAKSMAVHARTA